MYERKLKPETAEETKAVETIEGMRQRIREYARDDNLVYHVLRTAEMRGLSGDDTMTMLAYHALLERERFRDLVMEDVLSRPAAGVLPKTIP